MGGRGFDLVVGVDTHSLSHCAAVVDANGGVLGELTVRADADGYDRLLRWAGQAAPGRRLWAVEGACGYGAGLSRFLLANAEAVAEIDRPVRLKRRQGAKSDSIDAVRAAREAWGRQHLGQPRSGEQAEALQILLSVRAGSVDCHRRAVLQLKALLVRAPERLRARYRGLYGHELLEACARPRLPAQAGLEKTTARALRLLASRALVAAQESTALEAEMRPLVVQLAPDLLNEPGVGVVSAARLICAWSHHGRIRSEAAFAAMAGVAPIPASSGKTLRHRLSRAGDRQLNATLHLIAMVRTAHHAETRAYVERRLKAGKTSRDARRCLKRYLARRLFKVLEGSHALDRT